MGPCHHQGELKALTTTVCSQRPSLKSSSAPRPAAFLARSSMHSMGAAHNSSCARAPASPCHGCSSPCLWQQYPVPLAPADCCDGPTGLPHQLLAGPWPFIPCWLSHMQWSPAQTHPSIPRLLPPYSCCLDPVLLARPWQESHHWAPGCRH